MTTARRKGFGNGALLDAAEEAGFELLLTTDRRIRHQQDLRARRIALVVLTGSTKWSLVRRHAMSNRRANFSIWAAEQATSHFAC